MLRIFRYEISNGVLSTLEAFHNGGTVVSGPDLWPWTELHGGSVVLEGWLW